MSMRLRQNLLLAFGFKITLVVLAIFLYALPAACKDKDEVKDHWKSITFGQREFQGVTRLVDRYYIHFNKEKEKLAWPEAARYALMALPQTLHMYPEDFFRQRKKFIDPEDGILTPGREFKLKPADKFVIFHPDYGKLEELREARKKKKKKKDKELSQDEKDRQIKEMVELEKERKYALTAAWKKINFDQKDFRRVIKWLEKNHEKYNQPPATLSDEEKKYIQPWSLKRSYVAAANGYLSALDPHCSLMAAARWDEQVSNTKDSSFEGIGALLRGGGEKDTIVENPLEGRPAVEAGLRAGDKIIKVDEVMVRGMPLSRVVELIRGPKGTTVRLEVERRGYDQSLSIEITRQTIDIKNVSSKWLKNYDGLGYIKLTGFVDQSTDEIIEHFDRLMNEKPNMRGLILDLRNNPGGLLKEAIQVADLFVKKGRIVSVRTPALNGKKARVKVHRARMMDLPRIPLVVLVNSRSASASEIVASAIQDHKRGLVIGERSFGKASVQQLFPNKSVMLGNPDYYIKLTVSRYYAPSDRTIQVTGVRPDIEVSSEIDGSFPYRFREEDLWNHLTRIDTDYQLPLSEKLPTLKKWVKLNGRAEKYIQARKDAAIRPDVQLHRSADYLEAMIATKIITVAK